MNSFPECPHIGEMTLREFCDCGPLRLGIPFVNSPISRLNRLHSASHAPFFKFDLPPIPLSPLAASLREELEHIFAAQLSTRRTASTTVRFIDSPERFSPYIPTASVAVFGTDPIEQHGPFLPLETDIAISNSCISSLTSSNLGCCQAPSLNYGSMRWGIALGGSLSMPETIHFELLDRYVHLLVQCGIERAIVVSTHHAPNHLATLRALVESSPIPLLLLLPLDYIQEFGTDVHAGHLETSIMVALQQRVNLDGLLSEGRDLRIYSRERIESLSSLPWSEFCAVVAKDDWSGIVGHFPWRCENSSLSPYAAIAQHGRMMLEQALSKMRDEVVKFMRVDKR